MHARRRHPHNTAFCAHCISPQLEHPSASATRRSAYADEQRSRRTIGSGSVDVSYASRCMRTSRRSPSSSGCHERISTRPGRLLVVRQAREGEIDRNTQAIYHVPTPCKSAVSTRRSVQPPVSAHCR
ncbi:hypothetical protein B0H19DRAFT_79894 [Mycena capillaripes]|nr:hypothetical protein B0H19DRAFT_79894 [Mycena capillaripes]